ncbi:MAG: glycosyltransferase [Prolixibacteraceae bacterium]
MNVVIVHNSKIPVIKYGGTERDIWDLGYELVKKGHNVTYLVKKGSVCPFGKVLNYNPDISVNKQIPNDTDFVNLHFHPTEKIHFPHLISVHGNLPATTQFHRNVNFISRNHAKRYNADAYIYNGLNWDNYGTPDFSSKKNYVHFLGKAAWRVKNVSGAIRIAAANRTKIKILGGNRINVKMGVRITVSPWAEFYGMVGGSQKTELLKHSKGLIFPVLWHEPFGLAVIESLYFGCPVLATPFGSLPELLPQELGFLSDSEQELTERFKNLNSFDRKKCHEYARDVFNSRIMAQNYLKMFEKILNGELINQKIPVYNESENQLHSIQRSTK